MTEHMKARIPTPLLAGHAVEQLPHNNALGIRLLSYALGRVECALDWREDLTIDGSSELLASGPIVSLMDNACGYAIWSALDRPLMNVTLNLRIDYLRPPVPRQRLIGIAECHKITKKIAFARGRAHEGDPDDPVADVSASFFFTQKD